MFEKSQRSYLRPKDTIVGTKGQKLLDVMAILFGDNAQEATVSCSWGIK